MTRWRIAETHRTRVASGARRSCTAALAALALLLALAALAARAAAEPHPLDARAIWARADRVYIAATDSVALAPGDFVTLMDGRKTVAGGEVMQVLARDLAAARLTGGSLERVARLDRLRIVSERPPLPPLALLRIGYPGRARASFLFDCARPAPRPPSATFRTDSLDENAYRIVRGPGTAPWPDTILVRLFGESADEEIALERGELDIAVFWPGEASGHLRADPRWQALAYGARGVLAAVAAPGDSGAAALAGLSPDFAPLAALNVELFRGDLAAWRADPMSPARTAPAPVLRLEVDPSCPGHAAMERLLARAGESARPRPDPPTARLRYLESMDRSPDSLRVAPLFAVRCAIAFQPGLRARVAALGGDAIVHVLDCGPADHPR